MTLCVDSALIYERVRADVMSGQARPEALGAFVFHGMWQGMRVLSSTAAPPLPEPIVPPTLAGAFTGTHDRQLVRLLADMVLATQQGVNHAE